jgi:hypothetical protein
MGEIPKCSNRAKEKKFFDIFGLHILKFILYGNKAQNLEFMDFIF